MIEIKVDWEKAKTSTPFHPIPIDTQLYIKELESRFERIVEQLESIKVIRCKDCDLLQSCKNAQYLGLEGYCSNAEKVV